MPTQELSAEKSKMAKVETRLSSELSAHTQEITALQARMQASYQDHVAETQQLNLKVSSRPHKRQCRVQVEW